MITRAITGLIGMPAAGNKSGNREMAAAWSIGFWLLMLFSWPAFGPGERLALLKFLGIVAAAMSCYAFGMKALIKQAGLRVGNGPVAGDPPAPAPARPRPDDADDELFIDDGEPMTEAQIEAAARRGNLRD